MCSRSLLQAEYGDKPAEWFDANPVRLHVAGRMMFQRIMGKASFAKLQDRTGQIQIFLQRDALGESLRGVQEIRRRRHPRRHRNAVQDEDRRAVGARRRAAHADEVAAPAARQVARHGRRRHALSPALRRPHRQRAEPQRLRHAHADPQVPARLPRLDGFPRSRNADAAEHSGRRGRAPVQDASQRARHGHVPAHRAGAVSSSA